MNWMSKNLGSGNSVNGCLAVDFMGKDEGKPDALHTLRGTRRHLLSRQRLECAELAPAFQSGGRVVLRIRLISGFQLRSLVCEPEKLTAAAQLIRYLVQAFERFDGRPRQ